jgi:cysteine desulfurase
LCRARGVIFHTDAAQGVGKVPLDVNLMHIDLMSISGHKIYGPMGIGALYVRRHPNVRLTPLILGGGQESGLRSGTLPTPLCVGFGAACSIAGKEMSVESERIRKLRDALFSALTAKLPGIELNGHPDSRVTGNLNISFSGIDADELVTELDDLAVSTASACTSAVVGPSYVLRAIGIPDEQAHGSVRICIGRFTTETEVEFAIDRIVETVQKLCEGG